MYSPHPSLLSMLTAWVQLVLKSDKSSGENTPMFVIVYVVFQLGEKERGGGGGGGREWGGGGGVDEERKSGCCTVERSKIIRYIICPCCAPPSFPANFY